MKRIIHVLPLLVCIGGIGIIIAAIIESNEKESEAIVAEPPSAEIAVTPDAETYSQADRQLVQQVFENPQTMDDARNQPTASSVLAAHPANGATMSSTENESIPLNESTETIHVPPKNVESFASLRTDAVRNPESEQNQTTAKKIMQMRQRRVEQLAQQSDL